jgi:hypothetical protein
MTQQVEKFKQAEKLVSHGQGWNVAALTMLAVITTALGWITMYMRWPSPPFNALLFADGVVIFFQAQRRNGKNTRSVVEKEITHLRKIIHQDLRAHEWAAEFEEIQRNYRHD